MVEDEPDNLESFSYTLFKEGYEVETAKNGIQGVEKARLMTPDLIILDAIMKGMNGIEICSEIRKINFLSKALIVFLSNKSDDATQLTAFDVGTNYFIAQPITNQLLMRKLKALLNLKLLIQQTKS